MCMPGYRLVGRGSLDQAGSITRQRPVRHRFALPFWCEDPVLGIASVVALREAKLLLSELPSATTKPTHNNQPAEPKPDRQPATRQADRPQHKQPSTPSATGRAAAALREGLILNKLAD